MLSGQVVIQSEQEVQLRKLMRREEKRLQRQRQAGDDGDMEQTVSIHLFKEQVATASTLPILKQAAGARPERYPNVYDSLAEAKLSSGFVAGVKMALPASMERVNNSKYEEINIPAIDPSATPVDVGRQLIAISSLDAVGQRAFANCKTLNKIQSVVYETAYHTNENMLICAPTGAGKTNIAMLAIVHQIKQYIVDGVLQGKDQFKVSFKYDLSPNLCMAFLFLAGGLDGVRGR